VIVLDTDVLSELLRPEPDANVLAWLAGHRRAELYTTTISEGEIASGLALLPKGRRRDALTQAVARLLGEGLGGRVLPFDRAAAAAYGEITAKRRTIDEPVATAAGQIAAVARARGARLVATRDTASFANSGLKCSDPWCADRA